MSVCTGIKNVQGKYSHDFETIYLTDSAGNLLGISGDGIWGECQGKCAAGYTWPPPYPNPFNSATSIILNIPEAGYVSVQIYNIMDQVVTTLFSGSMVAVTDP